MNLISNIFLCQGKEIPWDSSNNGDLLIMKHVKSPTLPLSFLSYFLEVGETTTAPPTLL